MFLATLSRHIIGFNRGFHQVAFEDYDITDTAVRCRAWQQKPREPTRHASDGLENMVVARLRIMGASPNLLLQAIERKRVLKDAHQFGVVFSTDREFSESYKTRREDCQWSASYRYLYAGLPKLRRRN